MLYRLFKLARPFCLSPVLSGSKCISAHHWTGETKTKTNKQINKYSGLKLTTVIGSWPEFTNSPSLSQMAPIGAAVAFTRVRHLALSSASHVAANMDKPVCFLMISVHAVGGRPLPWRLLSFLARCPSHILPCFLHICLKYLNFLLWMLFWNLRSEPIFTDCPSN